MTDISRQASPAQRKDSVRQPPLLYWRRYTELKAVLFEFLELVHFKHAIMHELTK